MNVLKKIGVAFATMGVGAWVLKILYGIFVFLEWSYDEMGGYAIGVLVLMVVCWCLGKVATKMSGLIQEVTLTNPTAPPQIKEKEKL